MRIGQFSLAAGVSKRTLHHYEEIGLIPKAKRDGVYRTYESGDLERIQFILLAKELGFNLKEILEFVHIYNEPKDKLCQNSLQFIQDKTQSVKSELEALNKKYSRLKNMEKNILEVIKNND